MESFNSIAWIDSYIDSQVGLTDSEKQAAKWFKVPSDFIGISQKLENANQGHLKVLYIRLRAMSKIIRIGCTSSEEAEAATAFFEYLICKSENEDRVARSSRVEMKARREGWIKTVSDLVSSKKESQGFLYLVKKNRLDVSLETFVCKNKHLFKFDVFEIAVSRLKKYKLTD